MATSNRIYIDEPLMYLSEKLVKRAIPGSETNEGIFHDTRELVAFAVCLGYKMGKRRSVEKRGREIKLEAIANIDFGGSHLANALAVAAEEDVAILDPNKKEERAKILEDFLNGGLEYMEGFFDEDATAFDLISSLIKDEFDPSEAQDTVINLIGKRI